MSESLVRVSVLADRRRVDVCLPTEVPVVMVLPDLVRGLGVGVGLGAPNLGAHGLGGQGSARLVTVGGSPLDPERGLRVQGVTDGEVLTLTTGDAPVCDPVYDDLVEAVHERSRLHFRPWTEESARTGAQAFGFAGGLFAATLLALSPATQPTVVVALVSAVATGLLAIGLSRAAREGLTHVGAAWVASLHCAVAGGLVAGRWGAEEERLLVAGVCAAAMGALCLALSRVHWPLIAPPVVVALTVVLAQTVAVVLVVPLWKVLLAGVAVGVIFARLVPGAVVEATVVRGQTDEVPGVDLESLDRDLRVAHSAVLALGVSGSVLLVAVTPVAVSSGLPAASLLGVLTVLRLLRLRRVRSLSHVVAGLVGAGATGVVAMASVALTRPEWVLPVAGAGVVSLVGSALLGQPRDAVRRGWWSDVVEVALVVSVPPLLAVLWWTGWGI